MIEIGIIGIGIRMGKIGLGIEIIRIRISM